ncbi:MAG: hypothetical protein IPK54_14100 [Dokdonella sp.]|uniref:hypothetical protein n=1 Tax=Dokdonella sp. TaxID=2291710 RepID=UPI0025C03975|nr:hypothetical protein [Dokdonella sp.]MBK8124669.1 hypothetical protein [Dokdonella sp.]
MLELGEIFAVGIHAYAVMSNHVHVVLRIDPPTAAAWIAAENLESSTHTSANLRIAGLREHPERAQQLLASISSGVASSRLPVTTKDYFDLIDWTARLTRADKRGRIETTEPPVLRKLGLSERSRCSAPKRTTGERSAPPRP